jgi:hypothetical protein
LNFDVEDVVRSGARITAAYLIPGGMCLEYIKHIGKAVNARKKVVK